jgi:hypothetical protein
MNRSTARVLSVVSLTVVATLSARAQSATDARAPAAATTDDFKWLTGRWEGHLAGYPNAVAEMTFSAPHARLMVGMMRLTQGDTVLVVELISIVDAPTGPELRFRHFSPQLEASEPTFRQTMRLTAHGPEREVFENIVAYDKDLVSTQPRTAIYVRRGADGFIAHSDIIGSNGKPDVIEVSYTRVPAAR